MKHSNSGFIFQYALTVLGLKKVVNQTEKLWTIETRREFSSFFQVRNRKTLFHEIQVRFPLIFLKCRDNPICIKPLLSWCQPANDDCFLHNKHRGHGMFSTFGGVTHLTERLVSDCYVIQAFALHYSFNAMLRLQLKSMDRACAHCLIITTTGLAKGFKKILVGRCCS